MKKIIIFTIMFILFSACGKNTTATYELAEVPKVEKKEPLLTALEIRDSSKKIPWESSWTSALMDVLSSEDLRPLLDARISQEDLALIKCTNFNELSIENKKIFYIVFLAAISEAESDFETDNHTFNRSDKTMNIGLLQIDHASAIRHNGKMHGYYSKYQLEDPIMNLSIGTNILLNQVRGGIKNNRPELKGRLFTEKSYYWSVLTRNVRVRNNLVKNNHNIAFCK